MASREWRECRAREHARVAARLAARDGWEARFCESMARLPRRRRLTEKQLSKLESIVDRLFAGPADGALIEEEAGHAV